MWWKISTIMKNFFKLRYRACSRATSHHFFRITALCKQSSSSNMKITLRSGKRNSTFCKDSVKIRFLIVFFLKFDAFVIQSTNLVSFWQIQWSNVSPPVKRGPEEKATHRKKSKRWVNTTWTAWHCCIYPSIVVSSDVRTRDVRGTT